MTCGVGMVLFSASTSSDVSFKELCRVASCDPQSPFDPCEAVYSDTAASGSIVPTVAAFPAGGSELSCGAALNFEKILLLDTRSSCVSVPVFDRVVIIFDMAEFFGKAAFFGKAPQLFEMVSSFGSIGQHFKCKISSADISCSACTLRIHSLVS